MCQKNSLFHTSRKTTYFLICNITKVNYIEKLFYLLIMQGHCGVDYVAKRIKTVTGYPSHSLRRRFFHGKDWEILKLRLENGKNPDFWIKKIERNRNRDYENDKKLLFLGYTVLHFWGQDISKHTDECLQAIEEAIWDTKFSDTTTDYDISEE